MIGLKNNKNVALRQRLRKKNIHLLVVKNSLARRATEGTRLAPAFESAEGTMALMWGGEDIISLAKEVIKISEDKEFEPFTPKGGVMDGQPLAADQVKAVSKWPSRTGAVEHLDRPDSEPRREAVGPTAQRRRQAGQPDQEEERRSK